MTCKFYGKKGNSNRRHNGEIQKGIGYAYTQALIFLFLGIIDIQYILIVYNCF